MRPVFAWQVCPEYEFKYVRTENPRDPGIATIRLAQCEAGGGCRACAGAGRRRNHPDIAVDFPLPIYDGDLQAKSGVPKHAVNLKRMMAAHHGVLIVTPEYNSSVPALVKNTIDWVSRVQDVHETRGQVFRERVFAIASASGGRLGGSRALAALRLILSACHAQ